MFRWDRDDDGIVTVTMDMDGPVNAMGRPYRAFMLETVERLEAEPELTGVVFASAKKTFFAGADLKEMMSETGDAAFFAWITAHHSWLRRIERLKVPVVAAINGAALGGGFEICLACNHRVVADDPRAVVGLPEVTLGLLPGAGGCVRTVSLIGLEKALPVLLEGKPHAPARALALGLVDEVVPPTDLIPAAKAWIRAHPDAWAQPWDRAGFRFPGGGVETPKVRQLMAFAPTRLVNETRGLMPAAEAILDVAVSTLRVSFDAALKVESRRFCGVVRTPQSKSMTTAFFFHMNAATKGAARPKADKWGPRASAVLGAGMMGSGIAHAHAVRGLPTVLTDATPEAAEAGRARAVALLDEAVEKGRMGPEARDRAAGLITAGGEIGAPDLIVEAVFEDLALKERVIAETFPKLAEGGIFGTNTSTLPISLLARAAPDPSRVVGLHFFSPVHRMRLVEIIRGEATSDATLAKAFDYVQAIGKLPIVVGDGRGFFTSRVFGTYLDEGCALIRDGVPAAVVERAGWVAGMPVGPLAVFDEVSLTLSRKVREAHAALDARLGVTDGYPAEGESSARLVDALLAQGRGGRAAGGGFYDYPAGGPKRLWPGLAALAERDAGVGLDEAADRLLWRMSLETLRCLEDGVLATERDGNVGSILAFGFPAAYGGAVQFARHQGLDRFAARARDFAARFGPRFAPPEGALARLAAGDALAA